MNPDVVFAVVGVAPATGAPASQAAAAADAARSVMQAIEWMAEPPERLLLAAETEPTADHQLVEVYVR